MLSTYIGTVVLILVRVGVGTLESVSLYIFVVCICFRSIFAKKFFPLLFSPASLPVGICQWFGNPSPPTLQSFSTIVSQLGGVGVNLFDTRLLNLVRACLFYP